MASYLTVMGFLWFALSFVGNASDYDRRIVVANIYLAASMVVAAVRK